MKFLASFLLVLASVGCVTGQQMCAQGGEVPDCSSISFGLRAVWSQASCRFECPTKCPDSTAFRDCSGAGCSVALCAPGTTCYNDRCTGTKCVAKCVPNPTSPPPPPTVAPTQCAFGATIQDLRSNADFEISSPPVVHTAVSAASLLPLSKAQLVGGIDGFTTLSALFSFVEGGKINQYNVMYKPTSEMFVLYTYSAGENNHGWINPASESYRVARIGDESMYECRVQKACSQTCDNCGINGRCEIVNGCATCVVNPPPQPICTEACTAKCSAGDKCVFDKTCTPTCRSSTDNTCLLNDGNSRIVSGGKYYYQCNGCTCGTDGQASVCTRIGCFQGPWNNDGTSVCLRTCGNCGINGRCDIVNGCAKCVVYIQYPISFKVRYTGTVSQLSNKLRKVATDAKLDTTLVIIDNTQLVQKSYKSYQCRMAIKGPQDNTANRETYIAQLKKSFTITGTVKLLENGDNNDVQLDSEIESESLDNAQPFTTQTCADDTTIAASESCPAITEEGMIIPTSSSSSSSSFPLAIVIGSVVGGVIALVILTAAIIIIQRRRTANKVVARTTAEQQMTNTV